MDARRFCQTDSRAHCGEKRKSLVVMDHVIRKRVNVQFWEFTRNKIKSRRDNYYVTISNQNLSQQALEQSLHSPCSRIRHAFFLQPFRFDVCTPPNFCIHGSCGLRCIHCRLHSFREAVQEGFDESGEWVNKCTRRRSCMSIGVEVGEGGLQRRRPEKLGEGGRFCG